MLLSRELRLNNDARDTLRHLARSSKDVGLYKQTLKTIRFLVTNPRHPSLQTHKYHTLFGPEGEDVYEAYVQNNTPGAYRVFFYYGPDRVVKGKRFPVITILVVTPHP